MQSRLHAKIYGGGSVIRMKSAGLAVGQKNVEAAVSLLSSLSILIADQNIGGDQVRAVEIETANFQVRHRFTEEKSA